MSTNTLLTPAFLQPIIQTAIIAGALVTIATIVYKVTKEFRDMRAAIGILTTNLNNMRNQLNRIEGDIKDIERWNMEESRRTIDRLRSKLDAYR